MTNQLVSFQFHSHEVRTLVDNNGNPWFVAKDVCECFGLEYFHKALKKLRSTEKGLKEIQTLGGSQELSVINEPGLYRLIFRSNKPKAEAFQDWVYHEVLPTIRKTGSYNLQLTPEIQSAIYQAAYQAVKDQLTQQPQLKFSRYLEDTDQVFHHFVGLWFETYGTRPRRVKYLQPLAEEVGVFELLSAESRNSQYKRLGRWLTRNAGKTIADFIIIRTHDTQTGKHAYRLQREDV